MITDDGKFVVGVLFAVMLNGEIIGTDDALGLDINKKTMKVESIHFSARD